MNCLDTRKIYDSATMDSQELRRIKPAREIRETLIQEMPTRTAMQLNVIIGRFDPFDGVQGHEVESLSFFHNDAFGPLARACIKQGLQLGSQVCMAMCRDQLACPFYTAAQTQIVKRLQEIIDGVQLECLDSVFVIGCDKDDRRHAIRADAFHHIEPCAILHLDIEQHEVYRL